MNSPGKEGRLAEPDMFAAPPDPGEASKVELVKGDNIASLPDAVTIAGSDRRSG
jgi:hypothetical protein